VAYGTYGEVKERGHLGHAGITPLFPLAAVRPRCSEKPGIAAC